MPADWVAESLTHHASPQNGVGYGYQWWTEQPALLRIWYAAGYGGQRIVIVPERDAAVVINADYARDANEDGRRAGRGQSLLTSFILPALQRPAPGASSRRSGARP